MTRLSTEQEKRIRGELEQIHGKKIQPPQYRRATFNEAQVLAQVRAYLQATGWLVMRIHQSLGSHRGLPDLIALKNGMTVYIECKSQHPRAKLSGPQEIMQQEIERHGGIYVVVRGIEDLDEVVKNAG